MSLIEKTLDQFRLYLQDPDNIKNKSLRVFFEKKIIKINKTIGTRFFGLFSRKVDAEELYNFFACSLVFKEMCSILENDGFMAVGDKIGYSPDIKELYKVYYKNSTYVVISNDKSGINYILNSNFHKNFDLKGHDPRDVKSQYDRFVNRQNITNPLLYNPKRDTPSLYLKEFERRVKVYSWATINQFTKDEYGFGRFMKTFED
jgi:hypothetical protein